MTHMPGGANIGLQVWVKYSVYSLLLFINSDIIFHMNNCKPTFSIPCVINSFRLGFGFWILKSFTISKLYSSYTYNGITSHTSLFQNCFTECPDMRLTGHIDHTLNWLNLYNVSFLAYAIPFFKTKGKYTDNINTTCISQSQKHTVRNQWLFPLHTLNYFGLKTYESKTSSMHTPYCFLCLQLFWL